MVSVATTSMTLMSKKPQLHSPNPNKNPWLRSTVVREKRLFERSLTKAGANPCVNGLYHSLKVRQNKNMVS